MKKYRIQRVFPQLQYCEHSINVIIYYHCKAKCSILSDIKKVVLPFYLARVRDYDLFSTLINALAGKDVAWCKDDFEDEFDILLFPDLYEWLQAITQVFFSDHDEFRGFAFGYGDDILCGEEWGALCR